MRESFGWCFKVYLPKRLFTECTTHPYYLVVRHSVSDNPSSSRSFKSWCLIWFVKQYRYIYAVPST